MVLMKKITLILFVILILTLSQCIITPKAPATGSMGIKTYYIAGDSKRNENEVITFNKTFGGSNNDIGYSVQQTTDGGYIIAGESFSYSSKGSDAWFIKINDRGHEMWNHTFDRGDRDYINAIQQTTDGGYILVGVTESYGAGGKDIWILKSDSEGRVDSLPDDDTDDTIEDDDTDEDDTIEEEEEDDDDGKFPGDDDSSANGNGDLDENKTLSSRIPWLWLVIGVGVMVFIGIIVTIIRRRSYDEWDDEEEDYDEKDDEEDDFNVLERLKKKQQKKHVTKELPDANKNNNASILSHKAPPHKQQKKCLKCNAILVPSDAIFCTNCGANQSQNNSALAPAQMNGCMDCGSPVQPPLIFCDQCVMKQTQGTIQSTPYQQSVTGQYVHQQQVSNISVTQPRYTPEETRSYVQKPFQQPQKHCIKCSTILISPDAVFCTTCGTSQATFSTPAPSPQSMNCPGCGGLNAHGTAFCSMCGMNLQQGFGAAPVAPMVQQAPIMRQPVSNQFVQQPQTQAPVQPMAQQGFVQHQQVSTPAPMFPPQQQQQNPPTPPPPVPPGYGGLQ